MPELDRDAPFVALATRRYSASQIHLLADTSGGGQQAVSMAYTKKPDGGETGIRTLGGLAPTTVFETVFRASNANKGPYFFGLCASEISGSG